MDALLMCGGRGTRLGSDVEKPLLPVAGVPMVERVERALAASRIDQVYAVTSPHAPGTSTAVDLPPIETPGDGYVADLQTALDAECITRPVLTVAADLPLLDGAILDCVLDAADGALTVAVPVGRKRALGVSVDRIFREGGRRLAPSGVNVVGAGEATRVTTDRRLAVNVNRPADARRAAWLLAGGE